MKLNKLAILALSISLAFTSCSNDDDSIADGVPLANYENGIIISHEGNLGQGNASVSYISSSFTTSQNNIYSNANNGDLLGDTSQSITFYGDLAYIVMNGSNKVEVVNRYTFASVATINTTTTNPRYMAISNGKGYLTAWGDYSDSSDDVVLVIDLGTNTIVTDISTSYLPEEIIAKDNKIYVATGIYNEGNKVDVFNSINDEYIQSIIVGNSPNSLQLDSNGDLWVLSSENLIEINTNDDSINKTIAVSGSIISPSKLSIDNDNLYFYDSGAVYKMDETAIDFPTTPEFSNVSFYDLSVKDDLLYGLDAGDFASPGVLKVYDLNTNLETQSIEVGIIPGEVYFN